MGLDMYLTAERSFYPEDVHKTGLGLHKQLKSMFPEIKEASKTGNLEYVRVAFEVGYWRKANAIHKWFVDNCQEGVDDCKPSSVSREKLKELLELCEEIKKDNTKAPILLPTQQGFFFGTYDYDDWFFSAINETVEIIKRIEKLPDDWQFYYQSSW